MTTRKKSITNRTQLREKLKQFKRKEKKNKRKKQRKLKQKFLRQVLYTMIYKLSNIMDYWKIMLELTMIISPKDSMNFDYSH